MTAQEKYDALGYEVLSHYCGGGEPFCQCPGCRTRFIEFLCTDHVNADGAKHKEEIGGWGDTLWRWLKKNNSPPGFQVLCQNCNHAKAHKLAACPHAGEIH